MSCISYFPEAPREATLPPGFPNPFSNIPHPLAQQAARLLQQRLTDEHIRQWQHDFDADDGGRMMGVLVVLDSGGQVGFLSAFPGVLDRSTEHPGFVPSVFDQREVDELVTADVNELGKLQYELEATEQRGTLNELKRELSQLQQQRDSEVALFKGQQLKNRKARRKIREVIEKSGETIQDKGKKELIKLSFESQREREELKALQKGWDEKLRLVTSRTDEIESEIVRLKRQVQRVERRRERKRYSAYRLTNWQGATKNVTELYGDKLPFAGAGECAATKLLHYAQQHALRPLALAEFWWGRSPTEEVRHHGHFYPACRGRCGQLLPFMMKGLSVMTRSISNRGFSDNGELEIVYEDEAIVVVNKPSGLLSVPGKEIEDSVLQRLRLRYPNATGALLVHRLDMATSGLLLAAKSSALHKVLHQQFERRSVEKRYVAVVSKRLPEQCDEGVVELPLRVDIFDRPRQRICSSYGKAATTRWQVIAREADRTRLFFYPVTGRTHQLRLHAAHCEGLDAPIVGDELYGVPDQRLMLHAERLEIDHPLTRERLLFNLPSPF